MSAGCVVLAWDSEPVREFIADAETGLFVSASDWEAIERRALAVLDDQAAYRPLGLAATELVRQKYAQDVVLPRLAQLFDRLVQ